MSDQASSRGQSGSPDTARKTKTGGIDLASLIVIIVVLVAIAMAAFFVYRGSSLKSQLRQARNDAQQQRTRLQLQINTATAKARESVKQMASLRSQLDLAKVEVAGAKADSQKASKQVTELRTQLAQAKSQAAEAEANAKKAAAEVTQLRSQLRIRIQQAAPATEEPAQAKPKPPALPEPAVSGLKQLPLNVSFPKAPMLDGNALALKNTSTAILSLTVQFSNHSGSKQLQVTLDPGAVKELGWLGDWVLASGDKVRIQSSGYETIVKTAP